MFSFVSNLNTNQNVDPEEVQLNLGPEAPFGEYDVGGLEYEDNFNEDPNCFY